MQDAYKQIETAPDGKVLFLFSFWLYRFQTGFDYEIPDDDDRLRELLIHEICHIKAQGHGKKWANNMKKAQWDAFINPSVSKALEGLIDYDVMKLFDERLT